MRDEWPDDGSGLDNAVSCTRPRFWAEVAVRKADRKYFA
jgi:hypothetical protein